MTEEGPRPRGNPAASWTRTLLISAVWRASSQLPLPRDQRFRAARILGSADRRTPSAVRPDLHQSYRDTAAVEDVSFTVAEGEIFGILGPDGAGKTTTVDWEQASREDAFTCSA